MTTPPHFHRIGIVALIGFILGVFILHCALAFALYPKEATFVVCGLPLLAFLSYTYLFFHSGIYPEDSTRSRIAVASAISLVLTFFSCWGSMLIPINLYGT